MKSTLIVALVALATLGSVNATADSIQMYNRNAYVGVSPYGTDIVVNGRNGGFVVRQDARQERYVQRRDYRYLDECASCEENYRPRVIIHEHHNHYPRAGYEQAVDVIRYNWNGEPYIVREFIR